MQMVEVYCASFSGYSARPDAFQNSTNLPPTRGVGGWSGDLRAGTALTPLS